MIREVIVVEGKDDIAAVKAAVDCQVLATGGRRFDTAFLKQLRQIQKRQGIIILTDPDYAGKRIRSRINHNVPGAKNAFLPRCQALKDGDIGVENAAPEDIRCALTLAKASCGSIRQEFSYRDMVTHGLTVQPDAKERRIQLGKALGIGYGNAKQLLRRLNHFQVSREEFNRALEEIDHGE